MADKEVIKEEKVVTIHKPEVATPSEVAVARRKRRNTIFWLSGLGVVVLALLIAAAILAFVGMRDTNTESTGQGFGYRERGGFSRSSTSPYGYGTSVQTNSDTSGSVSTTVYNYLTGVVTAVNSDNIIVAGNGKTTTITTNSSTVYDNDTKPAVNDTVTIAGTTSGDTTTASEISVNN